MSKTIMIRTHDEELWEDFRRYLDKKYGTKFRVFSEEVERAVMMLLANEGFENYKDIQSSRSGGSVELCTHTQNLKPRQLNFLKSFYSEFKDMEMDLHDRVLTNFIKSNLNIVDKRSIWSWKAFLISLNWIIGDEGSAEWLLNLSEKSYSKIVGSIGVKA